MLKKLLLFSVVTGLSIGAPAQSADKPGDLAPKPGNWVDKPGDPVDYVNPLMGTQSTYEISTGNTYPSIGLPWGMNFWTPQTGKNGDGWQYTYTANKIRGLKQTHQPSPWMNDYGEFSILPVVGLHFREEDRASWFSHKAEVVKPYYYSVYLADYDITAELTPTERAVRFRFTFPKTDSAFVVIDAYNRASHIRVIPSENKIVGYSTRNSGGVAPGFRNYFVIVFDQPFTSVHTWKDSTLQDSAGLTDKHVGAIVGFSAVTRGTVVNARVASSFISPEQAERNLLELGKDDFPTVEQKGRAVWNETLGRVTVEGGTIDQLRTFYSSLYRMLFFPMRLYEKDASGAVVHYSPYNGKTEPGYLFGGTGFWDTFRALYPFLNLMYPSINKEMQEGLINDYKEGGWLPEWSAPGYRNVMIGNNSASVVADAWIKGLRGYDIHTLYEALLHDANAAGPIDAVGRKGVEYYNTLGYVPYDVNINENAARTLEYAYDDFSIYQLGKALGRPAEELKRYASRSQNYRHLFDPQHRLMRGKNRDGSFESPFNPFKWGDAFTEGNSWHYTWGVFHDIQGLIDLMGGKTEFVKMLDSVFVMPPVFDDSYYGEVIHEIREMQIANMGQYAHGNQPIQHMIYLYDYAGQPWKCQYWVRQTMQRMYQATPDGYCGDEDNGQTSAWYVFSALGFYPVCPATDQYVLGTPLFRKTVLHLANGKDFVINAPGNSATNLYVQNATLNGKAYSKNWITQPVLQAGGEFRLTMGPAPNRQKGVNPEDFPYSISTDKTAPIPDSATFYLHKFAQNIGKETYYRTVTDTGVVYTVKFKFVDRGSAVPLDAKIVLTTAGDPVSLWVKGNTSRFSTIHDSVVLGGGKAQITVGDSSYTRSLDGPVFPVAGYSPGTAQQLLLQYWRRHGQPASLNLLPTGAVSIRAAGQDTLLLYGQRLVLDRTVIHGLIWGNELVWTDAQGELVCLITNDAEGDKLEMMRDRYETLLPELIGRAATYGMALFAQDMHRPMPMKQPTGGGHKAPSQTPAVVGDQASSQTLAVVGGRMVDVATGETTNDAVILIRGGKILKTGARAAVPVPPNAKIIHAEGKTILPGLWDMHAHFEQAEWGPAYLAAGVTTVRDCGNEFDYINAVKRSIDEGHGIGPHILKAGIIDGPGPLGLGVIRASNRYEAVAAVRRYKDSGFVQIKIYSSVQPPVVKAICDEAHRLGMTVTGHIPEGMNLIQGVDSGMDMVNHIQYVGPILAHTKDRLVDWNDPHTAEGLAFIREHGTVIDPTLGVFEMVFRSLSDTITNMEPAFYSLPQPLQVLFRTMGMPPAMARQYRPRFVDMERMVKKLYDEGVPIVAGTDMGFPGWSVDRELELYVESGLTPLQALRTATIVPAMVMKQAAVSGTLMPGRNADLIILDGDPLHRIRDIRNVRVVIKDGKVYDPMALHRMAGFEMK